MYLKIVVIGIIFIMLIFDLWVIYLNYKNRIKPIPENVKGLFDEEKYQKWLKYSMDLTRHEVIVRLIDTSIILILLAINSFGFLHNKVSPWFDNAIFDTLVFLGIFYLLSTLASLPFDYYHTFVLENRYGFNKTTKKTFFKDQIKNLLLAVFLGGGLIALINFVFLQFQNQLFSFILITWAVLSIIILLIFFLNTKVFVKIFNKLTPLENNELKTKIEELATKVGFKVNAISVMDASKRSTKLNAFFSGLGKTREVVLYDTLIEKMSENEILAVLGHELGHAVHKDINRMLFRQILLIGLYAFLITLLIKYPALYTAFGLNSFNFGFTLLLFGLLMSPVTTLFQIPFNYLSRKAEYKADRFACETTDKDHIASALKTLAKENLSNLNPHPLYVIIHYSHPPIDKRLRAIDKYNNNAIIK